MNGYEYNEADADVNSAAKSWGAAPQPYASVYAEGLPCIQVAGVTVWLYRQNGVMRVSVDTDEADETTPWGTNGDVPVEITVNGHEVFAAH
jgi:hypothetical protein